MYIYIFSRENATYQRKICLHPYFTFCISFKANYKRDEKTWKAYYPFIRWKDLRSILLVIMVIKQHHYYHLLGNTYYFAYNYYSFTFIIISHNIVAKHFMKICVLPLKTMLNYLLWYFYEDWKMTLGALINIFTIWSWSYFMYFYDSKWKIIVF